MEHFLIYMFLSLFFIYFDRNIENNQGRGREREGGRERDRERERERERENPKQAPHCQHRV